MKKRLAAAHPRRAGVEGERSERVAKRIARAGLASRREAERWITTGRVAVDGTVLVSPAVSVGVDAVIAVDGAPLPAPERARLWRYHKPNGLVTSHADPQGRATVFAALPPHLPRVISVGRLDLTSEGLLLLTNDGELARRLELPDTGLIRRYRVRVYGTIDDARLATLAHGVSAAGVRYGPVTARLDSRRANNAWLTLALSEGRNREVRQLMRHVGLQVTRLIRVAYGPFQLGELPPGAVKEVPAKVLREQLG